MEDFQLMLEEVQALVQEAIQNKDNRPSYVLEKQLHFILNELDKMGQIRNVHLFCSYYPKGIADTWDYSNPLTDKLMDLFALYSKLQ